MQADRISQVRAELARLFDEQVDFFEDALNSSQARPNCANIKKGGSAYGSYLRNYTD